MKPTTNTQNGCARLRLGPGWTAGSALRGVPPAAQDASVAGPAAPRRALPTVRLRAGLILLASVVVGSTPISAATAAQLRAGVAKADITDYKAGEPNDPLYAKALVIGDDAATVAIVTVDAVAIGGIGRIGNDFLAGVRWRLEKELNIKPFNVLVNASHCHGAVCAETAERTVQAVREASRNMVPVKVGAGAGRESRIMENRRLKLKDGREADVRHAYSLPPDDAVAAVGPVDPEIGILRLDRKDGRTLAVVYNFACHPIQGVPGGRNTADFPGFASKVIEESLGEGAMALFLQGCAGDVNPAWYKDVDHPRDAEPLGNMLGLSAVRAVKGIRTGEDATLRVVHEAVELPRATDYAQRISAMEAEQTRLLKSLRGTSLNLKTFIPLFVKYHVSGDFPAYYSHRYLHDKAMGRDDLNKLDAENRKNMDQYVQNIYAMEELTRIQVNMDLLRMHQAQNAASGRPTIEVEVTGVRIGDFVLVTFPGELSVEIGLDIKKRSPHRLSFVAGCTNGYIYYAPTEKQRKNPGFAQEDCDCLVAPQWERLFKEKVDGILKRL